jgi:gliding motility-associated-like protein
VPVAGIPGQFTICEGEDTTLTATSSVAGGSFLWQPGNETTASITVSPAVTSTYSVTVTADGCTSQPATAQVTVNPIPNVTVPDPQSICPGEIAEVTLLSDVSGASFFWQPGNLTGSQQALSPDTTTLYHVYAEANGCTSPTDSFLVEISNNCNCQVIVPNVFTPNADMTNDLFHTINSIGCNFTEFDLVIYTRWGNKVWEATDAIAEWDGKFNGMSCSEGTYFWTLQYTHQGSGPPVKATDKGTLTIFK